MNRRFNLRHRSPNIHMSIFRVGTDFRKANSKNRRRREYNKECQSLEVSTIKSLPSNTTTPSSMVLAQHDLGTKRPLHEAWNRRAKFFPYFLRVKWSTTEGHTGTWETPQSLAFCWTSSCHHLSSASHSSFFRLMTILYIVLCDTFLIRSSSLFSSIDILLRLSAVAVLVFFVCVLLYLSLHCVFLACSPRAWPIFDGVNRARADSFDRYSIYRSKSIVEAYRVRIYYVRYFTVTGLINPGPLTLELCK